MKWTCGDCRLNGFPPRLFPHKSSDYLCHWQRTTDPDMIHGHKWRMCRRRSGAKTKRGCPKSIWHPRFIRIPIGDWNQISDSTRVYFAFLDTLFIIRTEYIENKKPPQGRLYENNSEKILFSHDILLTLQQVIQVMHSVVYHRGR